MPVSAQAAKDIIGVTNSYLQQGMQSGVLIQNIKDLNTKEGDPVATGVAAASIVQAGADTLTGIGKLLTSGAKFSTAADVTGFAGVGLAAISLGNDGARIYSDLNSGTAIDNKLLDSTAADSTLLIAGLAAVGFLGATAGGPVIVAGLLVMGVALQIAALDASDQSSSQVQALSQLGQSILNDVAQLPPAALAGAEIALPELLSAITSTGSFPAGVALWASEQFAPVVQTMMDGTSGSANQNGQAAAASQIIGNAIGSNLAGGEQFNGATVNPNGTITVEQQADPSSAPDFTNYAFGADDKYHATTTDQQVASAQALLNNTAAAQYGLAQAMAAVSGEAEHDASFDKAYLLDLVPYLEFTEADYASLKLGNAVALPIGVSFKLNNPVIDGAGGVTGTPEFLDANGVPIVTGSAPAGFVPASVVATGVFSTSSDAYGDTTSLKSDGSNVTVTVTVGDQTASQSVQYDDNGQTATTQTTVDGQTIQGQGNGASLTVLPDGDYGFQLPGSGASTVQAPTVDLHSDGSAVLDTGGPGAGAISIANAGSLNLSGGDISFQDGSGDHYTFTAGASSDDSYTIADTTTGAVYKLSSDAVNSVDASGDGLDVLLANGDHAFLGGNGLDATIAAGGNLIDLGPAGQVDLTTDSLGVTGLGTDIGSRYDFGANGALTGTVPGFVDNGTPTGALSDASAANDAIGLDTPSGAPVDSTITNITVVSLGGVPEGQLPVTSDPTGAVAGGEVIETADSTVIVPDINTDGKTPESTGAIVSGEWRPGNQILESPSNNLGSLLDDTSALLNFDDNYGAYISDLTGTTQNLVNIDPLVIDLGGDGISLSNWIANDIYFDTNVVTDPANSSKVVADGMQHHTSWVDATDGMLVFQPGTTATPITDITQTISEFFRGNNYANGFAALASLTQSGATSFSVTTALIDPSTGINYFDEIKVWQDVNQDGISQTSELESLSSLGITSISLQGSSNTGEILNGSAVTSRSTYTTSDGTVNQIASVDLQTDTTGDVSTTADGGVVFQSYSEGSPTPTTTFVAQNSSSHSYSVSDGTLIDNTTGQTVATGVNAVLSTTQGDTIQVAAGDTNAYWLGGGNGADTLIGGAGDTVFLINADTTVHGGTGFNTAKVIDNSSVNIDLMADNLQEVLGGAGGGVFNASGTTWNVFIQGGSGNNIIIGGSADDALSGGTGDDLIEAGTGGSVIHAGSGNDVIYGGSGSTTTTTPQYVNAGGSSNTAYIERLFEGGLGREAGTAELQSDIAALGNGQARSDAATAFLNSAEWQARYGTQTDAQFVTSIFENFVGRAPSSTELSQFTEVLAEGQSRGIALETVADSTQSQAYWASKHPGASDLIYGGPGNDTVIVGANNTIVTDGSGTMTVVGDQDGFSVVSFHGSYADYTLAHNADGTITVSNIDDEDGDGTVTMKDVTALDFKDIAQVSVSSTAGMPVNDYLNTGDTDQVTTNSSGQYVISAATILANDLNYAGNALSIHELLDNNGNAIARGASGQVNGGVAALSADGTTITFTPSAGFDGVMSFRYHVEDSEGNDGAIINQIGTTNLAEMNATVYLNTPSQPTDSLFDSEWFLQAANIMQAWQSGYTGAGVSIGVFDPSGNADFSNTDLAQNAGQVVQVDGMPGLDHVGTHATLVSGVIGAANDGEGAVGVAYGAALSSEAIGIGAGANLNNVFDWKNYDVVNNSWGDTGLFEDNYLQDPGFAEATQEAASEGRDGLGTAIVFAGGNSRATGDNTNYHNESNSRYEIVVGGINAPSDLGALQISGAPFSDPGASILVSAPANNISSDGVTYTNDFGQEFGADYQTAEGTSFATPVVAGVVALMLQANPTLGYRDIQEILAYSAVKVDPSDTTWSFNGADNWNGGGLHTSEDYGFGEVDALAAVRLAATWQTQDTTANEQSVNVHMGTFSTSAAGTAPLNYTIPVDTGALTPVLSLSFPTTAASELRVEHVDIELNLVGVRESDLIIKLIAPSGEVSILANRPDNITSTQGTDGPQTLDFTFDTVKDWGETSGGTWQIEVAYAAGTTPVGTVAGVNATIYGSPVEPPFTGSEPQTYIYTDEYAQLAGGTRSTLQDTTGSSDTINLAATTGAVTLDMVAGSTDSTIDGAAFGISAGTHVDMVFLGDGTTTVYGNNDGNTYIAGIGNDTVHGGSGNNTFYAGGANDGPAPTGIDTFYGGNAGNNFLMGTGVAHITGGTGGTNTIDFEYASAGVIVDLTTNVNGGAAAGDTFANIQDVIGSAYDDTISAWGGKELNGGAGTNTLDYSDATDIVTVNFSSGQAQVGSLTADNFSNFQRVIGGAGDDDFIDGSSLLSVDGGAGGNQLDFSSDFDGITLNLADGTGVNGYGNAITVANIQFVYGSAYEGSIIVGTSDTENMEGATFGGDTFTSNGSDTSVSFLYSESAVHVNLATGINTGGEAQGDILNNFQQVIGSQYNDTLVGNTNNNLLDGYFGNDTLTGGGGYDSYYFESLAGYGQSTITNGVSSNNTAQGELDIGTVLPQNIWLKRVGNNLEVDIMGSSSKVTIQGWYTNAYSQLQHIVAVNGQTLDTGLNDLVTAMATYSAAHPGFNPASSINPQITDAGLLAHVNSDWSAAPLFMAQSAGVGTAAADSSSAGALGDSDTSVDQSLGQKVQYLAQAMAGFSGQSDALSESHAPLAYQNNPAFLAAGGQQQHAA